MSTHEVTADKAESENEETVVELNEFTEIVNLLFQTKLHLDLTDFAACCKFTEFIGPSFF